MKVHSLRNHAAGAVTAVRLVLTPVFLYAVDQAYAEAGASAAVLLYAVIALSDVVDGRVAQATGRMTRGGRAFDHATDIVFVLSSLSLFVSHGVVPGWVPAAVAASFGFYALDWWRGRDGVSEGANRIGHAGCVVNYVLIGVVLGNDVCRLHLVPPKVMQALFAAVLLLSATSVASRLRPKQRMTHDS